MDTNVPVGFCGVDVVKFLRRSVRVTFEVLKKQIDYKIRGLLNIIICVNANKFSLNIVKSSFVLNFSSSAKKN